MARVRHPIIWTLLYLPFGALSGFVTVALTFLATRHGLSITEGALLGGAQLISQWLKWTWAPVVDLTSTPKRWYVGATAGTALGVFVMSIMPLGPKTLPALLAVVAVTSLVNSLVGMAIEAMLAADTPKGEEGSVSAWFQAGNLGGSGLGGGIGLLLLTRMPEPWMAGAIMATLFMACNFALWGVPDAPRTHYGALGPAVRAVFGDLATLARSRGGALAMWLCFLPIGTGAAAGVLTQAKVAGIWGAGENEVALVQGFLVAAVMAVGCFLGGWLSDRMGPKPAYASVGVALGVVAVATALTTPGGVIPVPGPPVYWYVAWSLIYSLGVGLAYAAFTAVVLEAIGTGTAATQYSLFASLSNFPIWWLGLLLGAVADQFGAATMLYTEAGLGVIGVGLFLAASAAWKAGPAR